MKEFFFIQLFRSANSSFMSKTEKYQLDSGFDSTATQIDETPNGKNGEQTTFCPTEVVRHTVVGSAGVVLDQVHYII
jgi:hypothetical protein